MNESKEETEITMDDLDKVIGVGETEIGKGNIR